MAKYGVDFFGYPKYGSATLPIFRAEPRARCVDYNLIEVSWDSPPGAWTNMRLVRNPNGPPVSVDDGAVILDEYRPGESFLDTNVSAGREYHYSVFVFASTTASWIHAGSTSARCTINYGYTKQLWDRLPGLYKLESFQNLTANQVEDSVLRRFLSLFGFQLDTMRTDLDALLAVSEAADVPYAATAAMLRQLGFDPEPELGSRVTRQLAGNGLALYQGKGTALTLENLANIVTGWDCDIRLGHNLLLDDLDTMTSPGFGRWRTDFDHLVVQARGNNPQTIVALKGEGYIAVDPTADAYFTVAKKGRTGRLHSVPVVQGRTYLASVYARGTGTASISIDWYASTGSRITFTDGSDTIALANNWSTRLTARGIAPPGARYAAIRVNAKNGPEIYFNAAQFEEKPGASKPPVTVVGSEGLVPGDAPPDLSSTPNDWQPARQVFMVLRADSINEVRNSNGVGESLFYWQGAGFYAPLNAYPDDAEDGFLFTWSGANQSSAADYRLVAADQRTFVSPGQQWTFLGEIRPGSGYEFSHTVPPGELHVDLDVSMHLRLYSGDVELDPYQFEKWVHIEATSSYADNVMGLSGFEDDWQQIKVTFTVPDDGSVTAIAPGIAIGRRGVLTGDTGGDIDPPAVPEGALPLNGEGTLTILGVVPLTSSNPGGIRVRNLALVPKPAEAAFYFDGSTPSETADYMWEGQPHMSRSHYYGRRTLKAQRLRALAPRFLPAGRAFNLLFAQPEMALIGSASGVQNYDVNPAGPPDLFVQSELDIRWRRLPTWSDLAAARASWTAVSTNNPTWNDVQDGS